MSRAARLSTRHRRRYRIITVDRCVITRPDPDGERWWNAQEGRYDDPEPIEVAAGGCNLVLPDTLVEQTVNVAGTDRPLRAARLELDHDVDGDIRIDDEVTIVASHNRHLVGRSWWVTALSDGTHAPTRVLTVTEEQPRGR